MQLIGTRAALIPEADSTMSDFSDQPPGERRPDEDRAKGAHRAKGARKARRSRFRESEDDFADEQEMFVEASELDTAFHHVEELGDSESDKVTFSRSSSLDTEMDMTPMVDVTFLLLIFFMVTAAFSLQKSLQVPTPRPDEASTNVQQRDPQDDPDLVTVHVDQYSSFRVVTTEWDVEAPSDQELLIKLREARQGNSLGRKPSKLLVMANIEALHKKVVTAMDAGSDVGMEEIQLMMVEEDE